MGNMAFFEKMIEKKLSIMHCGYIGKVVWTDGVTATVQPLGLSDGSESARTQTVVSDVPVACRYKITEKSITFVSGDGGEKTQKIAVPVEIAKGDLVACLCADRDITAARKGRDDVPPSGRHSLSDSIIVGIL